MNEIFTIGDFCFRLICPDGLEIPENFLKFRGGERPTYTYTIALTEDFPAPAGDILAQRPDLLVTRTQWGECRYIGVKGEPAPYACYTETAPDAAEIRLSPAPYRRLNCDPVFTSLLAMERRQIERNALILHCAYIEYRGQAILFSAPSETGKTTQASLWQRCRGAETVNGDRALLQRINGTWYARGWPVCGSSGVCAARDVPIRAVVTLSQSPVDSVRKLSPAQAFAQVYSQITVNRWNREAGFRAMELTEQLVTALPVYHLACTMDETAVQALEQAIYG